MSSSALITLAAFAAVFCLMYAVGIRLLSRSNLTVEYEKAVIDRPVIDKPPAQPFGRKVELHSSPQPVRRTGFKKNRSKSKGTGKQASAAASFQKQRVMNRSEFNVFRVIEKEVIAARKGYRVFAQINLGEIMQSVNDDTFKSAFRSINSKRVDMLIADRAGWPVLAIEYQGEGHYQGDAAARDAVKKKALHKAGIGYLEIYPSDSSDQILARVREHLGWKVPAAEPQPDANPEPAAHFSRARAASSGNV